MCVVALSPICHQRSVVASALFLASLSPMTGFSFPFPSLQLFQCKDGGGKGGGGGGGKGCRVGDGGFTKGEGATSALMSKREQKGRRGRISP